MDKSSLAELVRDAWETGLACRIGDESDYFELGGHSFQALQIIAKLDAALGTRIPLVTLFDAPLFGDFVDSVAAHLGLR